MRPLPALITLAALLAPLPAAAQQWYRVGTTAKLHVYVDLDSIRTQGDLILATEMQIQRDSSPTGSFKWGRSQAEYNCRENKVHFLLIETFETDGTPRQSAKLPSGDEWLTPPKGSVGAMSVAFICGARDTGKPVADPFKDSF